MAVLNGSGTQLSKVYNSPDLLGPILLNLGGKAGTGSASFTFDDEPFEHGGLYRECRAEAQISRRDVHLHLIEATLFVYNPGTGDVGIAVTDLDFTWEVPVSYVH